MNHRARVRRAKGLRNAERDSHHLVDRHGAVLEPRGEGDALEPLHREVRAFAVELPMRDVADHIRMVELRQRLRLSSEARRERFVISRQDLERDGPIEQAVVRAVHLAHPASCHEPLDHEPAVDHLARSHSWAMVSARKVSVARTWRGGMSRRDDRSHRARRSYA